MAGLSLPRITAPALRCLLHDASVSLSPLRDHDAWRRPENNRRGIPVFAYLFALPPFACRARRSIFAVMMKSFSWTVAHVSS